MLRALGRLGPRPWKTVAGHLAVSFDERVGVGWVVGDLTSRCDRPGALEVVVLEADGSSYLGELLRQVRNRLNLTVFGWAGESALPVSELLCHDGSFGSWSG